MLADQAAFAIDSSGFGMMAFDAERRKGASAPHARREVI